MRPGFKALVIDDDEVCRDVTAAALERLGASHVARAPDGRTALTLVGQLGAPFELVVCDLRMPRVDGIETLVGLASRNSPAMVIIASSANARLLQSAAETVSRAGIPNVRTLPKPLTLEALETALAADHGPRVANWSRWDARTFTPPDCSTKILQGLAAGQFVPFFEPKTFDGGLVGAEVHPRWHHPAHGILSPESFMSVARATGLLSDILFAILAQTALFCSENRDCMGHISVDLTLPVELLSLQDMPQRIANLLAGFGLAPEQLAIQVDADLWATASFEIQQVVTRLGINGLGLVANDCAANAVSGRCIRGGAPFNEIKLSEDLAGGAEVATSDAEALTSLVAGARRQGMSVTARGVDTAPQGHFAQELGCTGVQGRLVAPPLPAAEFKDAVSGLAISSLADQCVA